MKDRKHKNKLKPITRSLPASKKVKSASRSTSRSFVRAGLLALIWAIVGIMGFVIYQATQLPNISGIKVMTRPAGIRLMSLGGVEFASYGAVYGQAIDVGRIPNHLVDALLATEDRRFYYHFGVDPISILRAMVVNIKDFSFRQGASTITQQLAKNLFLTPNRSLERKVQELILAFWLETSFSKKQILNIYLNRVYFGSGAYGVDAAAQRYFDKSAQELGLYESALLIGLLKAPSRYNPIVNLKRSRIRTQQVLINMVDAELLSRAKADKANTYSYPIRGPASVSLGHRFFADWIEDRASAYAGPINDDREILTTLDQSLQHLAEKAISTKLNQTAVNPRIEAAMVVLRPDGGVLAMVGGRNYGISQFNRATQAFRQPGSAFKPIVYLAALISGYSKNSVLNDAPINIGGWKPRNFDGKFRGNVTLLHGLAQSLNVPSVRLSETIGRTAIIRLARQLGITAKLNDEPSLALGTGEVTLLQLTAVYAAIANGGIPVEPFGIREVRIKNGPITYKYIKDMRPSIAGGPLIKEMDSMLKEVIKSGTGHGAKIGINAAGKTGTSQLNRDAWFVGYAGNLIAGVWVGRDDAKPMKNITGGGLPADIWANFMKQALR